MAEEDPSEELVILVTYIVKVYAPLWFRIKCNWECKDGARNFHFMMSKVNELSNGDMQVVAQKALKEIAILLTQKMFSYQQYRMKMNQ